MNDVRAVAIAQQTSEAGTHVWISGRGWELGCRVLLGDHLAFGEDGRVYTVAYLQAKVPGVGCVHCKQALEGEEQEACRFCTPVYGQAGRAGVPRCPACAEGRHHDPSDLETCAERGQPART